MMKNDITYEYRVFTHRLIDLEQMEVGICTSKVIKGLKPKDKVNGRFFHTSDTDEWFFCWNNELQKLNLKGNSDVNAALAEVEKLIADAKTAVDGAKKTAESAKAAAAEAKTAADAASAAVESIGNKADKSEVELKADKSVVEALSAKVEDINVPTKVSDLKNDLGFVTETDLGKKGYATTSQVEAKQDKITDLTAIREGANKGATALQSIPEEYITETELSSKGYLTDQSLNGYATKKYVDDAIEKIDVPTVPTKVSEFENDAKYLTVDEASSMFAPIGSEGGDMGGYATKKYVNDATALKQDKIDDLNTIRSGAALGATALQSVPDEYITETKLIQKGYATTSQVEAKQDKITDLTAIREGANKGATALQSIPEEYVTKTDLNNYYTKDDIDKKGYLTEHQSLGNYYTKGDIDAKIKEINDLIGQATDKTNTILNA